MRTARKTIRHLYEECEKCYRNSIESQQMTREKVEKKTAEAFENRKIVYLPFGCAEKNLP